MDAHALYLGASEEHSVPTAVEILSKQLVKYTFFYELQNLNGSYFVNLYHFLCFAFGGDASSKACFTLNFTFPFMALSL